MAAGVNEVFAARGAGVKGFEHRASEVARPSREAGRSPRLHPLQDRIRQARKSDHKLQSSD